MPNRKNIDEYKPKMLVVEDEPIILEDTIYKLKSIGYETFEGVGTSEEAIESVEKNKPDLVLMDILIGGEMDGIEVAEKITNDYKIPVIFLTSQSDNRTFIRAVGTNPDNYLVKPINEVELKTAIETSLFQKRLKDNKK